MGFKRLNMMKSGRLRVGALAIAATLSVAACDDNSFQVIEELEFAASLNIDLSAMEMLSSGVYIQDLEVGDGLEVISNSQVMLSYVGSLADGSQFGSGQFSFLMGQGQVIVGFEQGVLGMRERGTRKVIIPPDLGYGNRDQNAIPAGSVLIFDITVDSIPFDSTGSAAR